MDKPFTQLTDRNEVLPLVFRPLKDETNEDGGVPNRDLDRVSPVNRRELTDNNKTRDPNRKGP